MESDSPVNKLIPSMVNKGVSRNCFTPDATHFKRNNLGKKNIQTTKNQGRRHGKKANFGEMFQAFQNGHKPVEVIDETVKAVNTKSMKKTLGTFLESNPTSSFSGEEFLFSEEDVEEEEDFDDVSSSLSTNDRKRRVFKKSNTTCLQSGLCRGHKGSSFTKKITDILYVEDELLQDELEKVQINRQNQLK